nr:Uncharacterised protein [Klebsiella pneumoniae]
MVRLHRVLLQMNRALGMFESQSKLWRWRRWRSPQARR